MSRIPFSGIAGRSKSVPRGLTLIEVMISIVLVSTILLVSVTASANLMRNNQQRRDTALGQQLSSQFLDEISSLDFRDRVEPSYGLETGEIGSDRTTFDDVDDYHGYVISPPTHRDGTTVENFDGWTVTVAVWPVNPDATGITTTDATAQSPLRLVVVDCTTPEGTTMTAGTFVSAVPRGISNDQSHEQWREVKLGFPNREIRVTAPLRNIPPPSPTP